MTKKELFERYANGYFLPPPPIGISEDNFIRAIAKYEQELINEMRRKFYEEIEDGIPCSNELIDFVINEIFNNTTIE